MPHAYYWPWIAAVTVLTGVAGEMCLSDGVPEESRSYILDDLGKSIPIGFLKGAMPSSDVLTEMLVLMVQEGLGFHAAVHVSANPTAPIYALAGCIEFDYFTYMMRCQVNETQVHVAVDAWIGSYAKAYRQFETDYPASSPVDLGSMGYAGEDSMYISQRVLQAAYQAEGLALDYYKSYNRTYHNAKQYFDSISDIPISELKPCNSTDFTSSSRMGFYAQYSGDSGGVELQPDGAYIGVCPDGYWWLAPACRDNAAECIPVLTAFWGWNLQALMQLTAEYGIPAAIGVSANFVNHVRTVRSLFFWYAPDTMFIELLPSRIVFPRHSPSAWARGDQSTAMPDIYIAKMASNNLQQKAPRVQQFVANINFELPEVQNLMLELKRAGEGSARNVSCQWMKDNRNKWESWVPIDTACLEGFGLIDGQGAFLDNRTDAAGCGLCPAGRASEEVVDVTGRTFRCAQCPPGHFQSKTYSTSCERCPKGSYSNSYGNVECQYCGQGFYEEQEAQTSCTKCPASRTTQLLGAISLASCVCTESHIDDGGVCTFCGDGLSCPLGSTLSLLQSVNDTGAQLPHVLGGYHSDPAAPLQVYKCQDNFCPGGSPGTCKGGRQGLTCGDCPADHYWASNECTRCGAVMWAWILALVTVVVGIFRSYYLLTSSYTAKASVMGCTTASLGMMLALFQNLGVLSMVDVKWPDEVSNLLAFASIFTFNLDALGFSCLSHGNVYRYTGTALFFLVVVLALPATGVVTQLLLVMKKRGLAWEKFKTYSTTGQFLQVSFTTMANVGLMPFMCYKHPTGEESVLKYTEVLCGSGEHLVMQIVGSLVVLLAGLFFSGSCFAAWVAPSLSGRPSLAAIRFLVFRFRPDVWWFGVILLARGPLLSLPAVVATDMPALTLALMLGILLASLVLQVWFLPWKSPILNLVDAATVSSMVMLLAISLGLADTAGDVELLRACATIASSTMISIMVFMLLLSAVALVQRHAMGSQQEMWLLNLGRLPDANDLFTNLTHIAESISQDSRTKQMVSSLEKLSVYDLNVVMRAIDVLADDLEMEVSRGAYSSRISMSTRSFRASEVKFNTQANQAQHVPDKNNEKVALPTLDPAQVTWL
ncbi:unnamed protein product [Effrenium voratum]|uniref:Tyrosine-protein kinase ephrin type A/B receptor-like domain-containing protein n=1 Tax=Effrenium voratum TaxID=2562239 RepID=A0AA36HTX5_9DINO|nr:unnamed protein product [Effrenium voratum]